MARRHLPQVRPHDTLGGILDGSGAHFQHFRVTGIWPFLGLESDTTLSLFEFEWLGLFPTLWHMLIALCP